MARDDALAILRDCRELDLQLRLDRGDMIVRGWLTESMRERIRQHKTDLLVLLAEQEEDVIRALRAFLGSRVSEVRRAPDPEPSPAPPLQAFGPEWTGTDDDLITWFALARVDGKLPVEPFNLLSHVRVVDPLKFYDALDHDIQAGPRGPRGCALVEELRQLREIVAAGHSLRREERGSR